MIGDVDDDKKIPEHDLCVLYRIKTDDYFNEAKYDHQGFLWLSQGNMLYKIIKNP